MSGGFRTQIASDIVRDGLGVELLGSDNQVVAEVFRFDASHTLIVRTFEDVPIQILEELLALSRNQLDRFEDGTPLPSYGGSGEV
jgi:hypothetical protein